MAIGAGDIFVTADDQEAFEIEGNNIILRDWQRNVYVLNEQGQKVV